MNPSRSPYRQLLWILPLTVAGAVIALLLYVILTPGLSLDYEGTLLMGAPFCLRFSSPVHSSSEPGKRDCKSSGREPS